jgi:hypothetical protein
MTVWRVSLKVFRAPKKNSLMSAAPSLIADGVEDISSPPVQLGPNKGEATSSTSKSTQESAFDSEHFDDEDLKTLPASTRLKKLTGHKLKAHSDHNEGESTALL